MSRQYERVPFFCKVTLTRLARAGPAVDAHSFDISLGGVGLDAQVVVPARQHGPRVVLSRKARAARSSKHVLGRVAYAKADESGNRIGIEFSRAHCGSQPTRS